MCLERVKGTRVATSAQESYSWMQQGGKETRFPVTLPVLQTNFFSPPVQARKINLFHPEWSVKDSRVKFHFFFFFISEWFFLHTEKGTWKFTDIPNFHAFGARVYRERDHVNDQRSRENPTFYRLRRMHTAKVMRVEEARQLNPMTGRIAAKVHARVCTRVCVLSFLLRDSKEFTG